MTFQSIKELLAAQGIATEISCAVYSTADLRSIVFNQANSKSFVISDLPRCVAQKDSEGSEIRFMLVGPAFYLWCLNRLRLIEGKVNYADKSYEKFIPILSAIDRIITPFEKSGFISLSSRDALKDHDWLINKEKWKPDPMAHKSPVKTFAKIGW